MLADANVSCSRTAPLTLSTRPTKQTALLTYCDSWEQLILGLGESSIPAISMVLSFWRCSTKTVNETIQHCAGNASLFFSFTVEPRLGGVIDFTWLATQHVFTANPGIQIECITLTRLLCFRIFPPETFLRSSATY